MRMRRRKWRDERTNLTWLAQASYINCTLPQKKRQPHPLSWEEQRLTFDELPPHSQCMSQPVCASVSLPACAGVVLTWIAGSPTSASSTRTAPDGGGPLEYSNWRIRRWLPLLKATAPNAKTVQTLMGHHSVAFTMDQYADAWPEALSNAGEKTAALLVAARGGKTVSAAGDD